ncbi:E3 ubiquitin-protein ligase RNF181-like [Adelges cooleyi]|uniref:E3 ubiquitin-protein ligase RNF181-like n=1 Tax=Adelges cooleyi TaxID=133065 RepID=UPI00217F2CF9|nr:E3 ubiquitin-protein ligase RNF181-like [Adelges cooleyi]
MASYFEELNVDENELPGSLVERLTRESFRMIFDYDPESYGDVINSQRSPPASKSEIEKLRIPSVDEILGEQCQICLCQYQVDDKALVMPCHHIFHDSCLKKWLKKSNFCPLCKSELKTDDELYELYKEEMKKKRLRDDSIAQLHDSMFG